MSKAQQQQLTFCLVMVRPSNFGFNEQTASSNRFQKNEGEISDPVRELALAEFDEMVTCLQTNDLEVKVFDDRKEPLLPDAVFPNNWVSLHETGKLVLYPMMAPNRRLERRKDIVDDLVEQYGYSEIIDLSCFENEGLFLEGTGSMLLDRTNLKVYACLSPRTHREVAMQFAAKLGYECFFWNAVDELGVPIYHTNVIMSLGEKVAIVCLEAIRDVKQREDLIQSLSASGKVILEISLQQVKSYAGNVLFVRSRKGESLVILSTTALASLTSEQISFLSNYSKMVQVNIPTIEKYGGGSARCMMAELFVPGGASTHG